MSVAKKIPMNRSGGSEERIYILDQGEFQAPKRRSKALWVLLICVCVFFIGVVYYVTESQDAHNTGDHHIPHIHYAEKIKDLKKVTNKCSYGPHVSDLSRCYICRKNQCIIKHYDEIEGMTLTSCSMLCSTPPLWPKPTKVNISNRASSSFIPSHLSFDVTAHSVVNKDVIQSVERFKDNLYQLTTPKMSPEYPRMISSAQSTSITPIQVLLTVHLNITVLGSDIRPKLSTDESYTLNITRKDKTIDVSITAPTYFGSRHALETLSQLIWSENGPNTEVLKILHDVVIVDSPVLSHRGILIDTARRYYPLRQLKNVVDGMAASKLNVLHLHLTNSISFPIVLRNNPELAKYSANSEDMVYTPRGIRDLIEYARVRGIRVVLEIGGPSHANEGWNRITKNGSKLVICGEDDVNNGHLNPDNDDTLNVLESVFKDLLDLGTDPDYFHIGGDEVNTTCFGTTEAVKKYRNVFDFWSNFTDQMLDRVVSANGNRRPQNMVIWNSEITDKGVDYLDKLKYKENLVIQYRFGRLQYLLMKRFKVVLSTLTHWHLDSRFEQREESGFNSLGTTLPLSIPHTPFTSWRTFYEYRPWGIRSDLHQFLGGEACLWPEMTDPDDLGTIIWPRAAAMAERLWSDPPVFHFFDVKQRLYDHGERLIRRGIKVSAM